MSRSELALPYFSPPIVEASRPARSLREVRSAILELLRKEKRPLTRRYIEAVLIFKRGFSANEMTKGIAAVWNDRRSEVWRTRIPHFSGEDRADYELYSLEPVSDDASDRLAANIHYSLEEFTESILARSGEHFVRSIMKRSGLFARVTPEPQLGVVPIRVAGKRRERVLKGDVLGTLHNPKTRVVVEVKNTREHWYPTKGVFGELMVKALALDALPIFVASYISAEARQDCARIGIATIQLGSQILPTSKDHHFEKAVRRARSVIGPTPFQFLNPDRPFKHGVSDWAHHQLDKLVRFDWSSTKERWDNNRDLAAEFAALLSRGFVHRYGLRDTSPLKQFQAELARRFPT